MNAIYWLVSSNLFGLAISLSDIFITFNIWEKSHDLSIITIYHLAMFASIPIAAIISGVISERKSPILSFGIGLVSRIVMLLPIVLAPNFLINNIWFFGMIYGFSIGMCAIPSSIIGSKIFENSLERFLSLNSSIGGAVNLIVPIVASFLIVRFGYNPILLVAIPFVCLSLIVVTRIRDVKFGDGSFSLSKVIYPRDNQDIKTAWIVQFIEGLKGGFLWTYGGILAYMFVGGLAQWGIYNFIFSSLSIVVGLILAKKFRLHLNKFFVITTGIFYSIACLFLGTNLGITFFLYYSLVLVFVSAVGWSSFWGTINKIMSQDKDFDRYRIEYYVASELPLALGRITPLLIIYAFGVQQFSDLTMRLSWVLIGLVPIISFSLLDKTGVWDRQLFNSRK